MYITKSLFVEYLDNPKLARRHVHDKKTYKFINDIKYAGIDGVAIGDAVEEQAKLLFPEKECVDISTDKLNRKQRHASYAEMTRSTMRRYPQAHIAQPAFLHDTVFVKSDLLVLNAQGTYDLVEVKSKNTIRKNTKKAPLLDKLCYDVSIQDRVLSKVLKDAYSGRVYICHCNKEYVREGELDTQQLLNLENVVDDLMSFAEIEHTLSLMQEELILEEQAFNTLHPYTGADYVSCFGEEPPKDALWSIPRFGTKKLELYNEGITKIADIPAESMDLFCTSKGEESTAYRFVQKRQQDETILEREQLEQTVGALQFPLFFYDYETVSSPVPLFQGTHPWQQVVVQYSCHKMEADGTITHSDYLIEPGTEDTLSVVEQLAKDLEGGDAGTYLVRYQGFENKRNDEMTRMFPQFSSFFQNLNAHTFDLMVPFQQLHYFDRRFQGSCSIKKVLPVLTDISYDSLAVSNGAVASDLLSKMIQGAYEWIQLAQVRQDLLSYCQQDTWAMVAIYQRVMEQLGESVG